MTTFTKREAAQIAAIKARQESESLIRNYQDQSNRRGTLTIDEPSGTVWLDGLIGDEAFGEVSAREVREAMLLLKGREITFRINSQGGSVDAGLEVFNILREHRGGLVTRGNLVASMGGVIFQAGTQRTMERTGSLMIHGPRCTGGGDAAEHARIAEMLEKYSARVAPIFAERSGKSEADIRRLFEGEHWYSPAEAVAQGFADSVVTPKRYPRATLAKIKVAAAVRAVEHRPRVEDARRVLARIEQGLR